MKNKREVASQSEFKYSIWNTRTQEETHLLKTPSSVNLSTEAKHSEHPEGGTS